MNQDGYDSQFEVECRKSPETKETRMYSAAVLTRNSAELLKWMIRATLKLEESGFKFETPRGDSLPHHMTINLGKFDSNLNPSLSLGARALLKVNHCKYSQKLGVCAIPVNEAFALGEVDPEEALENVNWHIVHTINAVPHITLCLKEGVAPKLSNELLASNSEDVITFDFDKTYVLDAFINEE